MASAARVVRHTSGRQVRRIVVLRIPIEVMHLQAVGRRTARERAAVAVTLEDLIAQTAPGSRRTVPWSPVASQMLLVAGARHYVIAKGQCLFTGTRLRGRPKPEVGHRLNRIFCEGGEEVF
jgi:hypothetical protein